MAVAAVWLVTAPFGRVGFEVDDTDGKVTAVMGEASRDVNVSVRWGGKTVDVTVKAGAARFPSSGPRASWPALTDTSLTASWMV